MKINSKVVIANLIVLAGLLLDYLIPHISDYQPFLSPHAYSVICALLPILNIVLRVVRPSVVPVEMSAAAASKAVPRVGDYDDPA